ncbi:acetylserotonin O-methyltransferase-like [Andrographis paniculata]|uniref:acetylserotonin O-methyltransferase-like n=1 Tax=Andrographis paniculata TaxID=175694 RepID=UPI0021E8D964|nr:acetylserotonin O-methyltransferase-like [Andrographis paniculata]
MSNEEESQAKNYTLKCIFKAFELYMMRCAINLGIPDLVENHPGGAATLSELSSVVGCSPSLLHRVMRYLTHHGIFKEVKTGDQEDSPVGYAQTAVSRALLKDNFAPIIRYLSSPESVVPFLQLDALLTSKNSDVGAFEAANGADLWKYNATNPSFSELFNEGMACLAKFIVSNVIEDCTDVFEGINTLVDVGGGNGTTLRAVVKACPWIARAVNFELPHNVSSFSSDRDDRIEHVGGDMFVSIPSADATLLMTVLHDWDDESCVKILKNCGEAIPKESGKVIIVDIVVDDDKEVDVVDNLNKNKHRDYHMALDMTMMAHTSKGRERTWKEWTNALTSAGFTRHTIKHLSAVPQSVIVAYPSTSI